MSKFGIFISIVVLISALVLLFTKLFTPQPLQITLQSGQEITTSTSEYFSLAEVLLLIISAFLVGTAATYLFYNSENDKARNNNLPRAAELNQSTYRTILPLLKTDEKLAVKALLDAGGDMQQNKLAAKLGMSKVRMTRVLHRLEQKNLISRKRNGFTNIVILSHSKHPSVKYFDFQKHL